jgi:formylglycine-generating enzyme required for sulfatase activity
MKLLRTSRFFITLILCLAGYAVTGGASAFAASPAPRPLPPPQVIADAGNARATVTWLPVANAISYNVYYSTSPGVTRLTGKKVGDQHSPHVVRDLKNDTTYYFVVTSVSKTGESNSSTEVSATPSATPPPPAPVDVSASPAGDGQVRVSWSASPGATGYQIYFSTSPNVTKETGKKLVGVSSPQIVRPLSNGVTYHFMVTPLNGNLEGAASFAVAVKPKVGVLLPPAPAGLTAVEGNGQIVLTWAPVSGATSYNLYYSKDPGPTKETGVKVTNAASPAKLTGLTNYGALFFVVTAVGANGESLISTQVSATPVSSKPVPALLPIPGGLFRMGDNLGDLDTPGPRNASNYAKPVHTVQLDPFYMDKYETTWEMWNQVFSWAMFHGYIFDHQGDNGSHKIGTNMPVTGISWYDAVKWLNARSEKEGRKPVYYRDDAHETVYRAGRLNLTNGMADWTANGYRLPTEAEWERAMRGGKEGLRYPWGNDLAGPAEANYNMGRTTSVGTYPPNGYGLHDMAGNVFEWVWDLGSDSMAYSWASDPITNPRGPTEGATRIRRGGAYTYGARYLSCYERMFRVPTYTAPYFGFRSASNQP